MPAPVEDGLPLSRSPDQQTLFEGGLWPSADYDRQLARLRDHIGSEIYLVEVRYNGLSLAVQVGNRAVRLLAVIDFPAADPQRRLYPHMILLDDGRGLNLGWIARISQERAFAPDPEQVLYRQADLERQLLFHPRQLSNDTIAQTSHHNLARLLGKPPRALSHRD